MGKAKNQKRAKRAKRKHDGDDSGPENEQPAKRVKQYTDDNAKLAYILNRLSDERTEEREDATRDLTAFVDSQDTEGLHKILIRLTKGLCSGRKAARFGYAVALTHVLEQLYGPGKKSVLSESFAVWQVVDLIHDNVKPPEGTKPVGQEKRDYALGRLFAYTAITESKIITDANDRKKLLASILSLAVNEAQLREECGRSICKWVNCIPLDLTEGKEEIATIFDELQSCGLIKMPEGVAIWLTITNRFPKIEVPVGIWHKDDPLNKKGRSSLATLLRGFVDDKDEDLEPANGTSKKDKKKAAKKMKPSPTQYTPHFVWDIVFSTMIQRQEKQNEKEKTPEDSSDFSKFWVEVVDNSLFSEAASMLKKMLGFQLFAQRLTKNPVWALQCLFTPNLRRCLINQRKDSGRYLHSASKASLAALHDRVVSTPDAGAPMVFGLIKEEKRFANFDQLSGSKTIANSMSEASETALMDITEFLLHQIVNLAIDEAEQAEKHRRLLADLLVQVVRNRKDEVLRASVEAKDSWLHRVLDTFVQLAYFTPTEETKHLRPSPPLEESTRKVFQMRLNSCLAAILGSRVDESIAIPYYVISRIRKHRKSSSGLELILQADKSIMKTIKSAQSVVEEIALKEQETEGDQKTLLRAFKMLFSLTVVQAYNSEPDAIGLLDELQACYRPVAEGLADQNAFDVLIEVVLGCVAKPSLLFRNAGEQAFRAFASELSLSSLNSMLDILGKKEGAAGQSELFDEDEDVGSDVDVDMEDASDVEVVDGSEAQDDSGEEDEDSEGDIASDENPLIEENSEEEEEEELARFENLLAQALKTSKPNGNAKEGDLSDDDDDDDADMDDDAMMALEPQLTQIFRERKKASNQNNNQVRREAKDSVVNFKNRVLDLLTIYIKQEFYSPLALYAILPLTRLVRTTGSQQVSRKAFALLKQYFDLCRVKKAIPEPANLDETWETLKLIHQEALKGTASKQHSQACSRASLFIARVLASLDRDNYLVADKVYAETREIWWRNGKVGLSNSFFVEWANWAGEVRRLL